MIRHVPVMAGRIGELLAAPGPGTWVDCTLGDGGHSSHFLSILGPDCMVLGLDRDPRALEVASARIGADPRFLCRHSRFSRLVEIPETEGACGFLFDFGVSSRQLDEDGRGFTIRPGVPLDLRMDPEDPFDLDAVLASRDEAQLGRELSDLADVPRSRAVARALLRAREEGRTLSSDDLSEALREAFPRGMRDRVREMARLAMALRMLVNAELEEIGEALPAAFGRLAPGGRLAVLTYHSVEDRLAKNILRRLAGDDPDAPRDLYGNRPESDGAWVVKGEAPSEEEIASNPRARSARLRVVERRRAGMALAGILLAVVLVGLGASVMVGCVWRQARHVQLEKDLVAARSEERRLRDSSEQLSARVAALRRPDAIESRAARWGWRRPQRQFRLAEPALLAPEERP